VALAGARARRQALHDATSRSRSAVLPPAHPPADAILAGRRRVWVGATQPEVAGAACAAAPEVALRVGGAAGHASSAAFLSVQGRRRLGSLIAATLDGRIATARGESR
jgi:hypothetical protein